ncbi:MAG: hypothetical protein U9N35_00820 [Euryarchaeota archaeon]|nr:hypothetical protein [Euryarchaeota archaeon]
MRRNVTLATVAPPKIVEMIEEVVERGKYRSKSDFVYQAVIAKLVEEGKLKR